MLYDSIGVNVAIVVSSPGPESLWLSNLPLIFPDISFTCIACAIPETDPERAYKFFDACDHLGIKGQLVPYSENSLLLGLRLIDLSSFDTIITHNKYGDGGDTNRKTVYHHVRGLINREQSLIVSAKGLNQPPDNVEGTAVSGIDYHDKIKALQSYDHQARDEDKPHWQHLIDQHYDGNIQDIQNEGYIVVK